MPCYLRISGTEKAAVLGLNLGERHVAGVEGNNLFPGVRLSTETNSVQQLNKCWTPPTSSLFYGKVNTSAVNYLKISKDKILKLKILEP